MRDAELAERIAEVHVRSRGSYGAPRVHTQLQQDGQRCGRRRVARLMRTLGLAGRYRRRRRQTTISDPYASLRPDVWSCPGCLRRSARGVFLPHSGRPLTSGHLTSWPVSAVFRWHPLRAGARGVRPPVLAALLPGAKIPTR
ncbi:IS3 family transposase [Streptosporangium sp. LJ11]|uniref:IS3 family transposase n=1 Tax=Streptosporangium sp. LJ11 TaxID=3436927 RepID=UPI003F79F562